jgi:hypothetical protein
MQPQPFVGPPSWLTFAEGFRSQLLLGLGVGAEQRRTGRSDGAYDAQDVAAAPTVKGGAAKAKATASAPPAPAVEEGAWACEVCTFINEDAMIHMCEMCGVPKP